MILREFFYMPKSDRRTFIFLCSLALVLAIILGAVSISNDTSNKGEIDKELAKSTGGRYESTTRRDDMKDSEKITPKLFYFDPNTADSTQLLQLGLRPWQVRNIYKYRARGGVYQCKEDFAYVYGLTVRDYRRLEPYIRIGADFRPASSLAEVRNRKRDARTADTEPKDFERPESADRRSYSPKIHVGEYIEINSADTTELMKIPGIGSYFSRQIVKYRDKLGGFVSKEQLLEIEDFPKDAATYIKIDKNNIQKLRVNEMTLTQLKRHPYINYYQARAITDYRRLYGRIRSMSELKLMKEFTDFDIKRISQYVEY